MNYTDIAIYRRRGTAAAWSSANPVLPAGQMGWETDTGVIKFGDGITAWNSLKADFTFDNLVIREGIDLTALPVVTPDVGDGFPFMDSSDGDNAKLADYVTFGLRQVDVRLFEDTVDVAVGASLYRWQAPPWNGTILGGGPTNGRIAASVATAGTTGTMVCDILLNGTTIMTTNKINIESAATSSVTAAQQPVLTTTQFNANDVFTFAVDSIHTTPAQGLTMRMTILPR